VKKLIFDKIITFWQHF